MTESGAYDREKAYEELYRRFRRMDVPPCPRCGAIDTASVQCGVIGLTIRLAATCRKFKLIAGGPKLGNWFCNPCEEFFDVPNDVWKRGSQ